MSYEDVQEIVKLDKVWKASRLSKFEKYVLVFFGIPMLVLLALSFLAFVVIFVISLVHTINAYMSGRDLEFLSALVTTGTTMLFFFVCFFIPLLWIIARENSEDLRSLIRFRTSFAVDLSVYDYNIIEGLTQTLERKGALSGRKYERDNLNNTQLDLVQAYLTKRYQRHVSISECLQFFSMGWLFVYRRGSTKLIRCFFVILDEKRGEVLFYSNDQDEWPYLREVLEEGGFLLSEVNETIVDMKKYVIDDEGSIERKREKDVELLIQ